MEFVKEKDAELSTKFMEQGKTKIHLAVCSGILATCGSLFGKLAGGAEFVFLVSGAIFEYIKDNFYMIVYILCRLIFFYN